MVCNFVFRKVMTVPVIDGIDKDDWSYRIVYSSVDRHYRLLNFLIPCSFLFIILCWEILDFDIWYRLFNLQKHSIAVVYSNGDFYIKKLRYRRKNWYGGSTIVNHSGYDFFGFLTSFRFGNARITHFSVQMLFIFEIIQVSNSRRWIICY